VQQDLRGEPQERQAAAQEDEQRARRARRTGQKAGAWAKVEGLYVGASAPG
jgi:hypothetical protein